MRSTSHFVKSLRSPSLSPRYISAAFKTEGRILTQHHCWSGSSAFQGVVFFKNEEKLELRPVQIQNRNLSIKSDTISVVLVLYAQSKLNKISKENQMVVPTQTLQEQPCMTWGELSLESLLKWMVCKRPQLGPRSLEDHVTPAGGSDLPLFASYRPECKICEN